MKLDYLESGIRTFRIQNLPTAGIRNLDQGGREGGIDNVGIPNPNDCFPLHGMNHYRILDIVPCFVAMIGFPVLSTKIHQSRIE